MAPSRELLSELFGNDLTFLGNIRGLCRHKHEIYSVGQKRIVVKKLSKELAEKEVFFYHLLGGICNTPKLYSFGEDFIITDFIQSSNPDLLSAIRDWAKVHSYFFGSSVLDNPLMARRKPKNLSHYVLNHRELFNFHSDRLAHELLEINKKEIPQTLIHGDLYGRNILTNGGVNYYIDFEFSGRDNPLKDLALILLNHPEISEEIISNYRRNISFDYEGIEEGIKTELLIKGTQLIIGLEDLKISRQQKKTIHSKFLEVMVSYL